MEIFITLSIMLILLLLKGFFSGSEIALVSADRIKLRLKASKGNKGALIAERMLKKPERLLSTTLLGTNISSIALTTIGTVLMVDLFADNGELMALIIFTPFFLIFGEIVPKSVYQQSANRISPVIIYPLSWLETLLMPVIWFLSHIAKFVARLLGGADGAEQSDREQVMSMVKLAESSADNAAFARGQVRRVLQFAQLSAGEVMWSLGLGKTLPKDVQVETLLQVRNETGQRLIPLYDEDPYTIVSVICLDVWDMINPDVTSIKRSDLERKVCYVLDIQPISDVFELMHTDTSQVVVVVNNMGKALGLITMKSLIRRSLGSNQSGVRVSENNKFSESIKENDRGQYIIDASTPISTVSETLGIELSTLQASTIGALIVTHFRHIPKEGERITLNGFVFEVKSANQRNVQSILAFLEE